MEQRYQVAVLAAARVMIYNDILEQHRRLQRHHQPREPLACNTARTATPSPSTGSALPAQGGRMSAYGPLAASYDALTRRRALRRVCRRLRCPARPGAPRRADAAGPLLRHRARSTLLLAARGYEMIGADASPDMLAVAEEKALETRCAVPPMFHLPGGPVSWTSTARWTRALLLARRAELSPPGGAPGAAAAGCICSSAPGGHFRL